ncbi:hypothetical protein [Pedobacter sandarakinus]|uniref:hypothetical protein n=1 Tax=Pedobacter sandarakinus TaxID=353156 RepID=UPI002247187C|nr:hypothetical protein [Pedobacter sandarakinus]MCX2575197.1 hypothetical protein [Pedobacter sandarakinus]
MRLSFFLVLIVLGFTQVNAQSVQPSIEAKVVYNASQNNVKGLKIFPKISLDKRKNTDIVVYASFYMENGVELKQFSKLFCCEDVAHTTDIKEVKQGEEAQTFLFIPYDGLNLAENKVHKVKFDLKVSGYDIDIQSDKTYHSIINLL